MLELRNQTRSVVERADAEGEVVLTDYGADIAVIRPLRSAWSQRVDDVLADTPASRDTGMLEWFEHDDLISADDLD